ncbi:MAG: Gfo/Idh/MocA family oxidoreductase, partial [Rhodobacteraceae bacterium]|nr:Gfo/Idh/MocA family oxidoreductase [Paracoccaceae bacterium]
MTKTVRWGILGAAHFAKQHMAPAMQLARNTELVALGTSDGAKAAPFKALAPGLKVHSSYDAVLNDPDIDAVYIPLPNHLHVAWVKKAIAAGKHVLCEKPIAMQASDIDELIALRDSAGLMLVEAYMIVHHPQWQYAKALFESGVIGDLVQVDGVFSYN